MWVAPSRDYIMRMSMPYRLCCAEDPVTKEPCLFLNGPLLSGPTFSAPPKQAATSIECSWKMPMWCAGWCSGLRSAVDSLSGEVRRIGPTDQRLRPSVNGQRTCFDSRTTNCRWMPCISSKLSVILFQITCDTVTDTMHPHLDFVVGVFFSFRSNKLSHNTQFLTCARKLLIV